jgi:hypothetical protein
VSQARVAVDLGSRLAKIVPVGDPGGPDRLRLRSGSDRAVLAEVAATEAEVCLAVPDAWLDGSEAGGRKQEALRQIAEDEFMLGPVTWAGQLAAVAALAASREDAAGPDPRRYLVCDAGATGVRVALCEVSAAPGARYAVRQVGVHAVAGGGWRDFDDAVRTETGAGTDPGLETWYEQAMAQAKRARMVFDRAESAPDFLAARIYTLTGAGASYELTGAQAARCFAPTAARIKAGVAAVLAGAGRASADEGSALTTVLTGGLAWFPLAAATLSESSGCAPLILRLEAAARGALLLADDQAGLGDVGRPAVSVPMHEVKDGLLTEVSVPLPWTASFGKTDQPLYIEGAELTLDIGASRVTVPLPGLAAGPYRTAARPSWAGRGILVLRSAAPATATARLVMDDDPAVRVVPLAPYAQEVTS